jgi:hypothetical protein
MEINYIIIFCVLMLIAYVFDLNSSRTKIPSVILLLGLGFGIQQLTRFNGLSIPQGENIALVERFLIIQVILTSAGWMMLDLMFSKTETNK